MILDLFVRADSHMPRNLEAAAVALLSWLGI